MTKRKLKVTGIRVSDIDLGDDYFRISQPLEDEKKVRIIARYGIPDLLLAVQKDNKYLLVTGHPIIEAVSPQKDDSITCIIINKNDHELFIRETVMMVLRGEVGPLGKLKALTILSCYFGLDDENIRETGINAYGIPSDFVDNEDLNTKLSSFPEATAIYLDKRDINFKSIRILLKLEEEYLRLVEGWVSRFTLRVNIFRELVEMLFDIQRSGRDPGNLFDPEPEEFGDQRQFENHIHEKVYRVRYPDYSSMKGRAEKLAAGLHSENIEIEYPRYFEKNSVKLHITISRENNRERLQEKINEILNSERFRELLEML